MTKDQILLSLNIEIESTRKELTEADKSERALFNGRLEGLRYARSLLMKFDSDAQQEVEEEERVCFRMDAQGNLHRV